MTRDQLRHFRKVLRAKRVELIHGLNIRDDIRIERAAGQGDAIQGAVCRDLAVAKLNHESNLLRQVEEALNRLAAHSYGICLHREQEIAQRRLLAVPWAALCIRCKEVADTCQRNEAPKPREEEEAELHVGCAA